MYFDINKIRQDFPILSQKINGKDLVYFDNAATSQKPQVMIEKLVEYYSKYNSNIHRGVHTLSQKATEEYENTRKLIARLYGCEVEEVIFTKSDTESLNLLAFSLGRKLIEENPNANIVITEAEHHSNIVPWQLAVARITNYGLQITNSQANKLTSRQGNKNLRYLEFNSEGLFDLSKLKEIIDDNTAILSFTWASNTFGVIYPIEQIVAEVRRLNPETKIIVDAAQYVPHAKFNFRKLDVDFITFSAHKLFGPTGVGVLIGKKNLLEEMPPFLSGGDMIKEVSKEGTTYNDLPYKFEAGTPNIADLIAFGASLKYLEEIGWENIEEQENKLAKKLLKELEELDFVEIYGPTLRQAQVDNAMVQQVNNFHKLPLVSFNLKGMHAHDVGTILDDDGIAVRTGHHCTQLIMKKLNIPASVRASLAFYNTEEEIDKLIESLKKAREIFRI